MHKSVCILILASACLVFSGCGPLENLSEEEVVPLSPGPPLGKADGVGVKGLPTSVDSSTTRAWTVKNQWQDTDTAAAKKAGIAWPENSGLNWDEKYSAWIGGMKKIQAYEKPYSDTFVLTTPWGKTIQAFLADCADVWIILRATFAAWYQLPFYMEGLDCKKGQGCKRIYFGHFGMRDKSGRWGSMPNFASAYKDHTALAATMSTEDLIANWPRDSKLHGKGTIKKDDHPFIREGARTGDYLDEIHLNKRAAHFIRLLLLYTGTPNLADSRNTFNLVPDAVRVGDAVLYRRARNGSGHTMVVMRKGENAAGKITVQVASGNDPPRQPDWESEAASKNRFTSNEGGGPTKNSKGEIYSHLGGGLKRWRVAKKVGGYWKNTFMTGDEANWIDASDYERIGERPALFKDLLGEVTPEEKRDAMLKVINDAREHLRNYPASCAARTRREDAFDDLYLVLKKYPINMDKEAVDKKYRMKEDYVFAELVYEQSKTCCWNYSTGLMFDIIMDHVEQLELAAPEGTCATPPVFMAQNGGYDLFKSHAVALGQGLQWKPWSADESCPQAGVTNDTEQEHAWTDYCKLGLTSTPQPPPEEPPAPEEPAEPDESQEGP